MSYSKEELAVKFENIKPLDKSYLRRDGLLDDALDILKLLDCIYQTKTNETDLIDSVAFEAKYVEILFLLCRIYFEKAFDFVSDFDIWYCATSEFINEKIRIVPKGREYLKKSIGYANILLDSTWNYDINLDYEEWVLLFRCNCFRALVRNTEAISDVKRIIVFKQQHRGEPYILLSQCFSDVEMFKEALDSASKAIDCSWQNTITEVRALTNRGKIYEKMGDKVSAAQDISKAKDISVGIKGRIKSDY